VTVDEISLASIAIAIANHPARARRRARIIARARNPSRPPIAFASARTGRRFRGEDAAELVEHPVLGRIEALEMLAQAPCHVANSHARRVEAERATRARVVARTRVVARAHASAAVFFLSNHDPTIESFFSTQPATTVYPHD